MVALAGDGGFGMTGQELITSGRQSPADRRAGVATNGIYGTIAMHQYNRYGADATYGVALNSPDFAAAARAWGRGRLDGRDHRGFCAGPGGGAGPPKARR